MSRPAAVVVVTVIASSLAALDVAAQPPRPAPLPQGARIHAQHGDTILLEGDTQVRIVRRRDAHIRVVFKRTERALVMLADLATKGAADGLVDWVYHWEDVSGEWPLSDRWEGPASIEEYGVSPGGPSVHGLGFTSPAGLIQLLGRPTPPHDFADSSATAVLRYSGAGSRLARGESFESAEARAFDDLRRSAQTGAQIQTFPGGGTTVLQGGVVGLQAPIDGVTPVRVGGSVRAPEKIVDVPPVLPDTAARAGVRGMVILEVTIGVDGAVRDARVVRGIPLLDAAALEAVRQWRYTPTTRNGEPVPVIMTVTVPFH